LFAVTAISESTAVALTEWLYFFSEFAKANSEYLKEILINSAEDSPHDFLYEKNHLSDWITKYSAVRVEYLPTGVYTARRKYYNFFIDSNSSGIFVDTWKEYPTISITALLALLPLLKAASQKDTKNKDFIVSEIQLAELERPEPIEFKHLFDKMEVYIEGYKNASGSYTGNTVYDEKYIFDDGEYTFEKETDNPYFEGLVVTSLRKDIPNLKEYLNSNGTKEYSSILVLEICTEDILLDSDEIDQAENLKCFRVKKARFLREEILSEEEKKKAKQKNQ
jgi:hypothetical protein